MTSSGFFWGSYLLPPPPVRNGGSISQCHSLSEPFLDLLTLLFPIGSSSSPPSFSYTPSTFFLTFLSIPIFCFFYFFVFYLSIFIYFLFFPIISHTYTFFNISLPCMGITTIHCVRSQNSTYLMQKFWSTSKSGKTVCLNKMEKRMKIFVLTYTQSSDSCIWNIWFLVAVAIFIQKNYSHFIFGPKFQASDIIRYLVR